MAFSAVTERGSLTEKVSDTSIAVSPSANLTVDKIVFVLVATDNAATTAGASTNHDTLADTDGNTWNKVYERTMTLGVALDGVTHSLWWTKVTTQIDTSDSITFTADTNATAKVIAVWEATVGSGNTIQVAGTSQFLEVTAINPAALVISGLPSKEYLFIGVMSVEDEQVTWTESATFTNIFATEGVTTGPAGTPASNITAFAASRIATDTGATFDVSYISAEMALALVAFEEVTTGGTGHTATQTDPEGLLDTATQVTTSVRDATDPLGLLDTTSQVAASVRSQIDPLGLLDSATTVQDHVRTVTDTLGMDDDGEWIALGTDTIGLLDNVVQVQTHSRTVTDPLGLLDDATYQQTAGANHTATITDGLGLLDSVTAPLAIAVTVTDGLGLTDTTTLTADYATVVTDLLGLTDSETHSGAFDLTITDLLGLTDSVTASVVGTTFWTPNPAGYTVNPAAYVPVGPDDTPPAW